jgi:transcriptional regulator with XRE-family HTH domain
MSPEQRYAQLRGPENPRSRGHSPARDQREAAAARAAGDGPHGDAPAGDQPAPSAAQGEKVKIGKYEVSEAELGAMMDRQAQEDLRAATRPAKPEAYEAKLPADLKLPGGQTYTFDPNDPSLVAARNLAHAKGWSQQDFSEALGIFASHIAGENAALAERSRAEIEKVGINAMQRLDAVGRFITAEMGEADAKQIRALIVTDSMLRYHERLMQKVSSQGSASFTQQHRVPPDDKTIPGYEGMSFEQRRQAQDQQAARRR